jgi:hypothetical protein
MAIFRASFVAPFSIICGLFFLSASAIASPPTIASISPNSVVQNPVPQPVIVVTGTDFTTGTSVTLRLPNPKGGPPLAEYFKVGTVNGPGTTITLSQGTNTFNLLQAPLGAYDVIVTRPDTETATLPAGFLIHNNPPAGIHLNALGYWGGPVTDIDVVGDLAYIANGKMLRVLNIANPANPVDVGSIDLGAIVGVRVRDGYAFVAGNRPGTNTFCVVDVSNPAQMEAVWYDYNTGWSLGKYVRLYGNRAYVGGDGTILAYDITDPPNVVYLGRVSTVNPTQFGARAEVFDIVGDTLYVGVPQYGAPGDPHADPNTGSVPISFRTFDITAANPLVPTPLGAYYSPHETINDNIGLSVEGGFACWVTRDWNGSTYKLQMLDVSNSQAPAVVGTNSALRIPCEVGMHGGRAYVADQANDKEWPLSKGLAIVDVANNPTNPTLLSNHKTHGSVTGLRVIGNRTYLFDEGEGLIIMDTSNRANPIRLGKYHSPAVLRKMAKNGDLLYIADCWHGFTVLNVADPAHPVVVGSYAADHYQDKGIDAFGIAYQNNRVYLGAGYVGVEVVDVTNPASPSFLGAFRVPDITPCGLEKYWGISMTGNIVRAGYLKPPPDCSGTPLTYVHNLNVSNPSNITMVGSVLLGNHADAPRTIAINPQKIGFIGHGHDIPFYPYLTINTQDDANPFLIATPPSPAKVVVDVALDGNILFAACNSNNPSDSGVYVYDVATPSTPSLLSVINQADPILTGWTFNRAQAVVVQNHRLYTAGGPQYAALHVFDVANPATPVFLHRAPRYNGICQGEHEASNLLVEEPRVYATVSSSGKGRQLPSERIRICSDGLVIYDVHNLPVLCPADISPGSGDGTVNIADLLFVIANWGAPGSNPADVNSDNIVNIADLLLVISNWGPCK